MLPLHTNTRCICCKVLNVETEAHHINLDGVRLQREREKRFYMYTSSSLHAYKQPSRCIGMSMSFVATMLWPAGAMRQQDRTALVPPGEVAAPARSVFSAASVGGADDHRRTFSMQSTGKATRRKKHGRSEPLLLALSHAALQRRFAICPCSPRRRQLRISEIFLCCVSDER